MIALIKKFLNLSKEYEQQAIVDSIFEEIIKINGNDNISKAFLENRIETLITDDLFEIKPRFDKNSCCLTEESNQLLKTMMTSLNPYYNRKTTTKYFTASGTKDSGKLWT